MKRNSQRKQKKITCHRYSWLTQNCFMTWLIHKFFVVLRSHNFFNHEKNFIIKNFSKHTNASFRSLEIDKEYFSSLSYVRKNLISLSFHRKHKEQRYLRNKHSLVYLTLIWIFEFIICLIWSISHKTHTQRTRAMLLGNVLRKRISFYYHIQHDHYFFSLSCNVSSKIWIYSPSLWMNS